jgi:hypothetical protein
MTIANTTIQIKKSGVTGNIPNNLNYGELGLNYVDGKLFYKNASGTMSYFYGGNNGPSFATAIANGTSITATAPNDILTISAGSSNISIKACTTTKTITIDSISTGGGASFNGGTITNALTISNSTPSTSNTTGALVVAGGIGAQGNIYSTASYILTTLAAGTSSGTPLGGATNPIISSIGSANNYIQSYIINYTNGTQSSSDFVAYPNNGSDSSGWVDMGITSNTFSQSAFSATGPNEGYLFMSAPAGSSTTGNLVIATDATGTYNSIEFYVGGFNSAKGTSDLTIRNIGSSTSTTNGTVQIAGGLAVAGNAYSSSVYTNGLFYAANGLPFSTGSSGATITNDTTTSNTHYILFTTQSSGSLTVANTSNTGLTFVPSTGTLGATIFQSLSDENQKTNIQIIDNAMDITENLRGVTFDWKDNGLPSAGLIAQDVEKWLPQLINSNGESKTLNYNGVIGVLVEAIKDLNNRVKELENKQ